MNGVLAILGNVTTRVKMELALMNAIVSVAKYKTLEHPDFDDKERDILVL
jgi:hypothetical protein